ncbi:hypothetical protein [Paenisporosarcina cavernae]|uniref:Lipoprotein n=1 Tax=Paenisporosarcina cavernae TaxID=2320858 RepID=A0A385YP55_9BACL|nr:hypothetical protein [Paenisporosarcina cavernae]AYC28459.1 hypothetical protein D3873_00700 [Paenisporosarcina cavernae]
MKKGIGIFLGITLLLGLVGCNEKVENTKQEDLSMYPIGVQEGIVSPELYDESWGLFEDHTYMDISDQLVEIYKMETPFTDDSKRVESFTEQIDQYETLMTGIQIDTYGGEKDDELASTLRYGVKIAEEEIIALRAYLNDPTEANLSNANAFANESKAFNRELSSFFTKNKLFPEYME